MLHEIKNLENFQAPPIAGLRFTYQGRLNLNGGPANGSYDMTFRLYNATNGLPLQPLPVTNSAVVVSNSLFTTTVNFGSAGIFIGLDESLEIGVRTNGSGAFATLSPRQPLTPTPQAVYATTAGTAYSLSASVVNTLNGLQGGVTLAAGTNVSIATAGNTLTISSSGGGGSGSYVAKAGDTMTGTLNLPANGLTIGGNELVMNSTFIFDLFCPSLNQGIHMARSGKITQLYWGISDADFGYFDLNGGTVLRGNSSQYSSIGNNLGIGLTVPSARLHVTSSGDDTTPQAWFDQANPGDYARMRFTQGGSYPNRWDFASVSNLFTIYSGYWGRTFLTMDTNGISTANNNLLIPSGKVGIGTTIPGELLTVGGGSPVDTKLEISGGGDTYAALRIKNSAGGWNWQVTPSADLPGGRMRLVDENTGAERISVNQSGNVGIGTGAPQAKLHLSDPNSVTDLIETGGGVNAWSKVSFKNANGVWDVGTSRSFGGDELYFVRQGAGNIAFAIQPNGDTSLVGSLGVGTATPTAKLDVRSSGITESTVYSTGERAILSLHSHLGSDYTWTLESGVFGSPGLFGIYDRTAGQARMTIDTSGNTYFGGPNVSVCTLAIRGGCDLAEPFPTTENQIEKGSVVVIDKEHPGQLKLSTHAYDARVAGIVSGANGINPGIALHQEGALDGGQNVALTGRVYVKADAGYGSIEPGDLITTSETPGHAMKVSDHARAQGAILGKAMSSLNEGKGMVLVLVTLQ